MSETKPTLLIIDGHSLAFRAFYALSAEHFMTKSGQHMNAVHGFISMLIPLLRQYNPTHLVVAFDVSRYSFRTQEYPEYKATRGETPPEFQGQTEVLIAFLEGIGVTTLKKENFEADDLLATLARKGTEEGHRVYVVSGDRDVIQLVTDSVTLLYPNTRGVSDLKVYTPEAVHERYGIWPHEYPEVAALVGEKSDNLIGIDKVGEKTAVKWVQKYGTVENIIGHAQEITGVVGQNLRDQQERALRNRRLNELRRDVELDVQIEDLERGICSEQTLVEEFGKLELKHLLGRMRQMLKDQQRLEGSPDSSDLNDFADSNGQKTALKVPKSDRSFLGETPTTSNVLDIDWDIPVEPEYVSAVELIDWVNKLDVEVIIHLEIENRQTLALGIDAAGVTKTCSVSKCDDFEIVAVWLAGSAPKIMHDAKKQIQVLADQQRKIEGIHWDTRIVAYLRNSVLNAATLSVEKILGLAELERTDQRKKQTKATRKKTTQSDSIEPEKLLGDDPMYRAGYYANLTRRLYEQQRMRTSDPQNDYALKLQAEIELPLIPVLVQMETYGVCANVSALEQLRHELELQGLEYADQAYAQIGREVNLSSPKQLQEVLFYQLGMPKTRATKTGYSTDAASLMQLQEKAPHPFLELLQQYRGVTKLAQMIVTLQASVGKNNRIHTTYDPLGTATGRISSNDPNLQNIPVRSPQSRRIREAFCVGEGYQELLTADYSQVEMRIMAHLSQDQKLIDAFCNGEDLHRFVGSHIFGVEPSEVDATMRTKVKAMSYGLVYGLGVFGLSAQLGISRHEAQTLMNDYFERFGAVRDYLRNVVEVARTCGYTETIFGRRRMFAELTSSNRVVRTNAERQALNAPIQGSAADIMKIAMIDVARRMKQAQLKSRLLLQVHDELIFEVVSGERQELTALVKDAMGTAAVLRVPLEVNVGYGVNWDAAAH